MVKAEFLNAEYEHDDVERSYRFPLDAPRMEAKRFLVEVCQPISGKRLL